MSRLLILLFLLFIKLVGSAQTTWKKESEELLFDNPPFDACHASTLVESTAGKLMVSFFAGPHEGHKNVSIWQTATVNGKQWSPPTLVADGVINDTLRFPCWNPVLFKTQQGKLFLFYKVGPNPREWWGMVRISNDSGLSWSKSEKLPQGILGPIKNKPIQLDNGTILSPSSVEDEKTWKVHIETSSDFSNSWNIVPVDTSSTFKVIQPSILQYGNRRLQLVCRSDQDRIVSSWSEDNGKTWSAFSKLELPNPNSGIDAVSLNDGTQLIVYNPTTKGKEWFNKRGKLNVAVSRDGLQWKDILVLENEQAKEYSYPAVIQTVDGKVHITYTYDRKNIKHVVLAEGK